MIFGEGEAKYVVTNCPPVQYSIESAGDVVDSESCGIGVNTSISIG